MCSKAFTMLSFKVTSEAAAGTREDIGISGSKLVAGSMDIQGSLTSTAPWAHSGVGAPTAAVPLMLAGGASSADDGVTVRGGASVDDEDAIAARYMAAFKAAQTASAFASAKPAALLPASGGGRAPTALMLAAPAAPYPSPYEERDVHERAQLDSRKLLDRTYFPSVEGGSHAYLRVIGCRCTEDMDCGHLHCKTVCCLYCGETEDEHQGHACNAPLLPHIRPFAPHLERWFGGGGRPCASFPCVELATAEGPSHGSILGPGCNGRCIQSRPLPCAECQAARSSFSASVANTSDLVQLARAWVSYDTACRSDKHGWHTWLNRVQMDADVVLFCAAEKAAQKEKFAFQDMIVAQRALSAAEKGAMPCDIARMKLLRDDAQRAHRAAEAEHLEIYAVLNQLFLRLNV